MLMICPGEIEALEEFQPLADNSDASEMQNLRRIAKIESPAAI
jgi:hypothetical protein